MRVDFHAHILPRADHGSDSVTHSIKQLRVAANAGVDVIVATPHFYMDKDSVDTFIARRERSYEKLMNRIADDDDLKRIKIIKSAEVNLQVGLDDLEGLERLCIENTNYLLLEMPSQTTWTHWVYDSIYKIESKRGLKPIIAHVDRYKKDNVKSLADLSVPMQVNAEGVTGLFARRITKKFIKNGSICALGSDVHQNLRQYKLFDKAIKIIGKDMAQFRKFQSEILDKQNF